MSESQKDQNAQGDEAAEANNQQAKSAAAAAAEQENLKEYKNLMDDKALDELDHVAEGEDKSAQQGKQTPSEVDDFFAGQGGETTEANKTAPSKPSSEPKETQEDLLG